MIVIRCLFPVGQGGFAVEVIDSRYCTVFDCGSSTSPTRVSNYIDAMNRHGVHFVDKLFISHFDKDHVNCIRELIDKIGVKEVVIPDIPKELRYVYNVYTGGAYLNTINLFQNRETELSRVDENGKSINYDMWEWHAKSMLTNNDWQKLNHEFIWKGLQVNQFENPDYIERNKKEINDCFKVFGSKGPNSKGLIVLSQKTIGVQIDSDEIIYSFNRIPGHYSGCFYTGDADLKNKNNHKMAFGFLKKNMNEQCLLLAQIPHHGSSYYAKDTFDKDFVSEYYFYCDRSSNRLQQNATLYNRLVSNHNLFEVRDIGRDLVLNKIIVR